MSSSSVCSVTTLITDRLEQLFGDKLGDFKRALQACNAIIAGSFVTQSILKESWPDSDVDIYVPVKMNCHLTFPTKTEDGQLSYVHDVVLGGKKYYSDAGYLITEIEKFLYENSSDQNYDGSYLNCSGETYIDDLGPSLCGMRTYYTSTNSTDKTKTMKFQVMQINTNGLPIERFIFDTFDFDICKCYYQIIQNIEMVSCVDLKAILSKTCEFSYGISPRNSHERSKKYMKRGFKFMLHRKELREIPSTELTEMIFLLDQLRNK